MRRQLTVATFVALLPLLACGVPVESGSGGIGGPFPHAEDYVRIHMEDAEEDDSVCFLCHAQDEDGQPEDATNLHCSFCHAYPPVHLELGDDDDE